MPKDRTAYQTAYKTANYKRVPLEIKIDKYDEIKAHSLAQSETVNGFIKRAIDETMRNDNAKK